MSKYCKCYINANDPVAVTLRKVGYYVSDLEHGYDELQKENIKLRECLSWYADIKNHEVDADSRKQYFDEYSSPMTVDKGFKARSVLGSSVDRSPS